MEISKEQRDAKYNSYLGHFKDAKDWAEKLSQGEDKLILTISSGALVLSVTFISTIITPHGLQFIGYLKWSWIFLVATIILNLLSVSFSLEGTLIYIKWLDKWLKNDEAKMPTTDNCYNNLAERLSQISRITLILGIILMTYFAWFNINSLIPLK